MERKDVVRSVVQAAGGFNDRRLWMRFSPRHCFGVKVPEQEESMLGVVFGAGGEEFGLSLLRGPEAAACVAAVFPVGRGGQDALDELDMLGFSMDKFGNLPPDSQDLLREAGMRPRPDEQVPHFLTKPPGQRPRAADASELTLLLLVLQGIIKADKQRRLQPATLDSPQGISILTIGGAPTEPQVSAKREKWQSPPAAKTIPPPSAGADLQELPRLDETWLVGTPALGVAAKADDRAAQFLVLADEKSESVLDARSVSAGETREAVDAVLGVFRQGPSGRRGLPRTILCSNRELLDALTPILNPLGVQCTFMPAIPKLREIARGFLESVEREVALLAEEPAATDETDSPIPAPDEADSALPAPDDLDGWKAADLRLVRWFLDDGRSGDRFRSPSAVQRYFDDHDLAHYMRRYEGQAVAVAYTSWCVLDYRPGQTDKTPAEEMLEEGLPAPEAILLRARMQAYPSLYRVVTHHPQAGTVDLEDVLLGGTVTIHDQLMSEKIVDNVFYCARAFPAGQFRFLEPAGPPLDAGVGREAVEFLRHNGLEFTPEGLRRGAHLFGWLWRWTQDRPAQGKPRLRDTDDEELFRHTWDEQEAEAWKSRGVQEDDRRAALPPSHPSIHSPVHRATDEGGTGRPLKERPGEAKLVEMTPEMISAAQEMVDRRYATWADLPLPTLRGRTPRQACRTEAGRRRVTTLIRTMPDPSGPVPLRVPREALLRELGLATEPSSEAPSPPATAAPEEAPLQDSSPGASSGQKLAVPVLPNLKFPRNAPCPCGSGRKYKKCCGRSER
jgi:hypothetical protein